MLIDCDTCAVRGQGCDDCVVTVLLGAPPGWQGSDPTVVSLTRHPSIGDRTAESGKARVDPGTADRAQPIGDTSGRTAAGRAVPPVDTAADDAWSVVDLDEVERRAVQALAEFGLVPPLRHQDASTPRDRHVS